MPIESSVAHYKVLRRLGSGGMGEVYLAQDTVLGRQVALKVLLPGVAEDPGRRARFAAEARAVAALNHPNIVTVHSVEESGGVHFITMEYVAGKPMSAVIPATGLPLKRFLELALPLVEAVAAAHQQGVIHRDLKPDNVMVSDDGRVKVLDFGLAKLKAAPDGDAEAETLLKTNRALTNDGQILGTVAYMSPEQAEGKPLDHRSDIFSLGILLFEMATGRRPFAGDSAASIVSAILRDEAVSVNRFNPDFPQQLARVIHRCLAKEPSRRSQNALDIRNELAESKQDLDSGVLAATRGTRTSRPRWVFGAVAVVAALAVLGIAAGVLWQTGGGDTGGDEAIRGATFTQLTHGAGQELFPSISPDGRTIVYASGVAGNMDIYSQRVGGQNPVNLTAHSAADEFQPAFSPDGERIAFRSDRDGGGIFVMGATGESVRRLTNTGYHPAWSPDGTQVLYVTQNVTDPAMRFTTSEMWAVAVADGARRLLAEGDAVQPAWSPNGHRIAFWGRTTSAGPGDIWTMPATGGPPVAVTSEPSIDWNPVWAPDGRYLYFASDRGGSMNLWRVPIDERSGAVLGPAASVTTGGGATNQHVTISKDGQRLAYVSRVAATNVQRVSFDPATERASSDPQWITRGSLAYAQPDPSPDGKLVAFNSSGTQEDIFVASADGSGLQQLTDDAFEDRAARWAPGGQRLAFYSNRTGKYEIWTVNRDGGDRQQLTRSPGAHYPVWSPDGGRMAYSTHSPNGAFIFDTRKPWNEQKPQPLPAIPDRTQTFEIWSWSPDGRQLAGQKHLTDLSHAGIAVHEIGSNTIRWLTDAGEWPVWMRDSRRLLFSHRGSLVLIDSATGRRKEILALPQNSLGSVGLSEDNRGIYITLQAAEADVWMMTLK
jgi:Tol biopolymer transport system component/serine/threonine protein kinase